MVRGVYAVTTRRHTAKDMTENIRKVKQTTALDFKYSILLPTWNNLGYLQLCLDSIRKNSHFNHQIIVLINEGADGTVAWVESQSDLDYVHSKTNIGICYGLNICRSLVSTDFIVYVNDDMYMLPDWDLVFDREIATIGHRNFMLSGTMIEPTDTGNPCVLVQPFGTDLETFREADLLSGYRDQQKADWSGSTWPPNIIPLELWDLVGGMSVEFSPGMYSDPDFSMKLWHAGVRYFKGLGNSRVYHFGSKSTKRVKVNPGKKVFLRKWGMSSGFFTKAYLRRGEVFAGDLEAPVVSSLSRLKHKIKFILEAL